MLCPDQIYLETKLVVLSFTTLETKLALLSFTTLEQTILYRQHSAHHYTTQLKSNYSTNTSLHNINNRLQAKASSSRLINNCVVLDLRKNLLMIICISSFNKRMHTNIPNTIAKLIVNNIKGCKAYTHPLET